MKITIDTDTLYPSTLAELACAAIQNNETAKAQVFLIECKENCGESAFEHFNEAAKLYDIGERKAKKFLFYLDYLLADHEEKTEGLSDLLTPSALARSDPLHFCAIKSLQFAEPSAMLSLV